MANLPRATEFSEMPVRALASPRRAKPHGR
jgi:hypothetical protein